MTVLPSYSLLRRWSMAAAIGLPLMAAQVVVPTLFGVTLSGSAIVLAQEEQKQEPSRETKRTQALSNKAYEKLSKAQKAAEEKDYSGAIRILDEMTKGSTKPNDFELANALNLYAFIYYTKEDYPSAIAAYKKILMLPGAPEGMLTQARYQMAQLYFVTDQWQQGIDALLAWFKVTPEPGANAYILLAQAYFQLNKFDLALKNVDIGVAMKREGGKTPDENALNLQRYLYQEKGDNKKVLAILNEMLLHYPKKQYWLNLSQVYGELKDDGKQLAALEAADRQNMLNAEGEIVNLTYLFLMNDVPYKAAKNLESGMKQKQVKETAKNLELLGNAWRQARELDKAIPVMVRAAKASDKGELWAQLGNVYLDDDQYQEAIDAVTQAFKKGGVKRPDTANLVLGTAYFNLKKYDSARKAFKLAGKDKRSKPYVDQWIKYMDSELQRQQSLQQG